MSSIDSEIKKYMPKYILVPIFIVFCCLDSQAQNNVQKTYSTTDNDCCLTLNPDFTYILGYTTMISDDIVTNNTYTAGIWKIVADTIVLNDTIYAQGYSNSTKYKLLQKDEHTLVNLNLKCFLNHDTLKVFRLRDYDNHWIFNGQINQGKMSGVKIDTDKKILYKIEDGVAIESFKF